MKRPRRAGPIAQCRYPQSFATARPIALELGGIAANRKKCARFYLDTKKEHSNPGWREGRDHHQGLARTHRLSDGSVYLFLTHSELDDGEQGQLMQFRYAGPLDGGHVVETHPMTVALLTEQTYLDDQHPSDLTFLPDVNDEDSGYLFVTESHNTHRLLVYFWKPGEHLSILGSIFQGFPADEPGFVFLDRVDDVFYLGISGSSIGRLYTAKAELLFPECTKGSMNIEAFSPATPESMFIVPSLDGASQTKLIRDSLGDWYLLGFRSDTPADPNGTDYVDVYQVRFSPFAISPRLFSQHVIFKPGETGFASTGTHYVEPSGRLLLSSSTRWSNNEGPGNSAFVSRVDECASAG